MILTCPKCQSRYDVDPAGISEAGTYAHCRTCENIFFVKRKKKQSRKPPSREEAVPVKEKIQPATAEDIEAAIADIAAELNPKTAGQDKGEPGNISAEAAEPEAAQANSPTQEEIDSLLSAVSAPEQSAAEQPEMSKQDEIDAMLASVNTVEPEQTAPVETAPVETAPVKPAPEKAAAEKPAMSKQDEIDAMLASVNTDEPEQTAPVEAKPEQPAPEKAEPEQAVPEAAAEQPAMSQQDEVDAMLASVDTVEPEQTAPVEAEAKQPVAEQAAPEKAKPVETAPDAGPEIPEWDSVLEDSTREMKDRKSVV